MKILVADSASVTHFMLERILGKEGYELRYVRYPRDLVTMVRETRPDVLFLEPEISGGRGRQIAEYLDRQAGLELPLVLITRIADIQRQGLNQWPRVHRILRKPFRSELVLEAVQSLPQAAVEDITSMLKNITAG